MRQQVFYGILQSPLQHGNNRLCPEYSVWAAFNNHSFCCIAHIFIDDGMEMKSKDKDKGPTCNAFVKQLVDVMELAAT